MRGTRSPRSLVISIAAAAAFAGCGKKKGEAPPPTAPAIDAAAATAPTPPTPPTTPPPAPLPSLTRVDLGAVSADPVTEPESLPAITFVDDQPAIAYRRGAGALTARWTGTGWQPITGASPCANPEALAIAAAGDGELVIVGAEAGRGNCGGRSKAGAWGDTGVPIAHPAFHVTDARVIATSQGPVAVLHHVDDRGDGLAVVHWDGAAWKQVAAATVGEGKQVTSFDAAGRGDLLHVAWVERVPQQPPTARAQRLNVATMTITELPAIAGVDGDTRFRLAAALDGTVLLARTWNPGFKEVLRLPLDAPAWTSLGAPAGQRPFTAHGLPAIAVGPGGAPVLAWAGELIDVAIHDGVTWRDLVTGLGRKPNLQSELQIAASGPAIALTWKEGDASAGEQPRIKAALLAPAPAK